MSGVTSTTQATELANATEAVATTLTETATQSTSATEVAPVVTDVATSTAPIATDVPAHTDMAQSHGILDFVFGHDDWVLQGAFLFMVLMSVISWSVIVYRVIYAIRTKSALKKHMAVLCSDQHSSYEQAVSLMQGDSPVKALLEAAVQSEKKYQSSTNKFMHSLSYSDYLMRNIRHVLDRVVGARDSGMTFLASIGATAPFVGLFGTVWGIYHALIGIASMGAVNIATISGPIGEALIATAFGLFVAIPAVLAYNLLNRSNRLFSRHMDSLAHDIYSAFLSDKKE